MSKKPVSPLRQRLIDDITARRFGEDTKRDYVRNVRKFAAFLGRCVSGQALHFYYCARREGAERPRYRRYDLLANRWDHLIEPRWGGASLEINGLDGVFIGGL